jgi:hypothetical protein
MNDGKISECGTYDELMMHNGPFAQFLLQYLQNEPPEELNDPESELIFIYHLTRHFLRHFGEKVPWPA